MNQYFTNKTQPAGNYMFKVDNKNARTRCEVYSKLTIKTPGQRQQGGKCGGKWRGITKISAGAYRGNVYVWTYTISFYIFVLRCLVLFVEIQPYCRNSCIFFT